MPPRPPSTRTPHPLQHLFNGFQWTDDANTTAISAQTKGFAMLEVAQAVLGTRLPDDAALDAARFINARFSILKSQGRMPRKWQVHSSINAEMTTRMGFSIIEDLEIMQWVTTGRTRIDTKKFVKRDRAYHEVQRRADWLCGLPGLKDRAVQIEQETTEAFMNAQEHEYEVKSSTKWCESCDGQRIYNWTRQLTATERKTMCDMMIREGRMTAIIDCPADEYEWMHDRAVSRLIVAIYRARRSTNDPVPA